MFIMCYWNWLIGKVSVFKLNLQQYQTVISQFSLFYLPCKLQRNPLSKSQPWCWGLYLPPHIHKQALLVAVIMMLVDSLTQAMYFCAVCELPKCVFWHQSGSCIVRNVDEKWQAIITCHSCPLLSPSASLPIGGYFKKMLNPTKMFFVLLNKFFFQEYYTI